MQIRNVLLVLAVLAFALSVSVFGQSASRATRDLPSEEVVLERVENPPQTSVLSQPEPETQTPATTSESVPVKSLPKPPTVDAVPPVDAPLPAPATTTKPIQTVSKVAGILESSLVNILCSSKDSRLHSTSGTGIFIDSRGLILTAAHVVEIMLLADYTNARVSCIIRTGSPAENAYLAKIAYISPAWIKENARSLVESVPMGTGENDFAILAITGDSDGEPVEKIGSAVPLSHEIPAKGESVSAGSYGAEFLSTNQILSELFPVIDSGKVKDIYTFDTDTEDLLELGGGTVAQGGSSGGGVLNTSNELIGLITTSSRQDRLVERDLRAITVAHLERSFKEEMNADLQVYLANHSLSELITNFEEKALFLASVVIKAITK